MMDVYYVHVTKNNLHWPYTMPISDKIMCKINLLINAMMYLNFIDLSQISNPKLFFVKVKSVILCTMILFFLFFVFQLSSERTENVKKSSHGYKMLCTLIFIYSYPTCPIFNYLRRVLAKI